MGPTKVGLVMGSNSDWDVMQAAAEQLEHFGIDFEARVVSAHRTPDLLFEYAASARDRGLVCIIAGAGGAAQGAGGNRSGRESSNAKVAGKKKGKKGRRK